MIQKLLLFFSGVEYDVFISYKRDETDQYALSLANYLAENGFSYYLDQVIRNESQDDLPYTVKKAAKNSRMLVIIGSTKVKESRWIPQEIEAYLKRKQRSVVPIAFDDILNEVWFQSLKPFQIIKEKPENIQSNEPSEYIKNIVVNSFQAKKRNQILQRRAKLSLITVLSILIIGSLIAAGIIRGSQKIANDNQTIATARTYANDAQAILITNPTGALLKSLFALQQFQDKDKVDPLVESIFRKIVSGQNGFALIGHNEYISAITTDSTNSFAATGDRGGKVIIWDIRNLRNIKKIANIQTIKKEVSMLEFFLHGTVLLVQTGNSCSLYMLKNDIIVKLREFYCTAICISIDRTEIAISEENGVRIFTVKGLLNNNSEKTLFTPFNYNICHLAFSPDKTWVGGGTDKSFVLTWNLSSNNDQPNNIISTGHIGSGLIGNRPVQINILQFDNKDNFLLTGSQDCGNGCSEGDSTIKVWNINAPKKPIAVLNTHFVPILAQFNDDKIITISHDGNVTAWKLSNQHQSISKEILYHLDYLNCAYLIPEGRRIVVGSSESQTAILEKNPSGKFILNSTFKENLYGIDKVFLSPSGYLAITSSPDRELRLFDLSDNKTNVQHIIGDNPSEIVASSLSPDNLSAAIFYKNSLDIWNVKNPAYAYKIGKIILDTAGYDSQNCPSCQLSFSPDGKWLVVQGQSKNLSNLYHIGKMIQFVKQFKTRIWSPTHEIIFSPNSKFLLAEENGHTLYKLNEDNTANEVLLINDNSVNFFEFEFSPNGKWLAGGTMFAYRKRNRIAARIWFLDGALKNLKSTDLHNTAENAEQLQFSPNSKWLTYVPTSSPDGIRIGDMDVNAISLNDSGEIGKNITLKGSERPVNLMQFSPDGKWLLTAATDILLRNTIVKTRLWPLSGNQIGPPQIIPEVDSYLRSAFFSPSGKFLLTVAGYDLSYKLFELNRNQYNFKLNLIGPYSTLNRYWYAKFDPSESNVILYSNDDPNPYLFAINKNITPFGKRLNKGAGEIKNLEFNHSSDLYVVDSKSEGDLNSGGNINRFNVRNSETINFPVTIVNSKNNIGSCYLDTTDTYALAIGNRYITYFQISLNSLKQDAALFAGRNLTWQEWSDMGLEGDYKKVFQNLPVHNSVIDHWLTSAQISKSNGDDKETSRLLSQITEHMIEIDDAEQCNNIAWSLIKDFKKFDQALPIANRAIKLNSDNALYVSTRGIIEVYQRNYKAAISDFETYTKKYVNSTDVVDYTIQRRRWLERLYKNQFPFVKGDEPFTDEK